MPSFVRFMAFVISIKRLGLICLNEPTPPHLPRLMFRPPPHTIPAVFGKLRSIAELSGASSMAKKVELIKGLMVAGRDCEVRYLVRSLQVRDQSESGRLYTNNRAKGTKSVLAFSSTILGSHSPQSAVSFG